MSSMVRCLTAIVLLAASLPLAAQRAPERAAVASAHPLASAAGAEVFEAGGNAFDAAVTVSAALSVVEPYGSGIGGGAFFLLRRAEDGHEVMIDARDPLEIAAPASAVERADYAASWSTAP